MAKCTLKTLNKSKTGRGISSSLDEQAGRLSLINRPLDHLLVRGFYYVDITIFRVHMYNYRYLQLATMS